MYSTRYSYPILNKFEFSGQFFEKYSSIKFHEIPSIGSQVVPCRQTDGLTDMTKLIVAFRNFAKASKKLTVHEMTTTIHVRPMSVQY